MFRQSGNSAPAASASAELLTTGGGGSGVADVNLTEVGGAAIALGATTAANSLPVVLATNGTVPLPTGAATLAEQQTQTASLSVLDDWDESDRAKVNLIVGQAGVAANAGEVSATTQRFIAAIDTNLITRRDNYNSSQTDVAIVTVSGGTKIVVYSCTVSADSANTAKPAVRIGFGATNTPTGAGVYLSHPGVPAGGGIRQAGAVEGGDGEDLRITMGAPTSGSIDVVTVYRTI